MGWVRFVLGLVCVWVQFVWVRFGLGFGQGLVRLFGVCLGSVRVCLFRVWVRSAPFPPACPRPQPLSSLSPPRASPRSPRPSAASLCAPPRGEAGRRRRAPGRASAAAPRPRPAPCAPRPAPRHGQRRGDAGGDRGRCPRGRGGTGRGPGGTRGGVRVPHDIRRLMQPAHGGSGTGTGTGIAPRLLRLGVLGGAGGASRGRGQPGLCVLPAEPQHLCSAARAEGCTQVNCKAEILKAPRSPSPLALKEQQELQGELRSARASSELDARVLRNTDPCR